MTPDLIHALAGLLSWTDVRLSPVSGGDINDAFRLEGPSGEKAFLKSNDHRLAQAMFQAEVRGLQALAKAGGFVPAVLAQTQIGNRFCLVLEWIEPGARDRSFFQRLGRSLSQVHRSHATSFGWPEDNFIATLPQSNAHRPDFHSFYGEQRLLPLGRHAMDQGIWDKGSFAKLESLVQKLDEWIPAEPPALVHGDLWNGNVMAGRDKQAYLIDPACWYGHRELDLAMSKLFGGFDPSFYGAYEEAYPLSPGWEDRADLFQLYFLLVHLVLFGSGYARPVQSIIERYIP